MTKRAVVNSKRVVVGLNRWWGVEMGGSASKWVECGRYTYKNDS